jgi:hypothetical protein
VIELEMSIFLELRREQHGIPADNRVSDVSH